MNYAIKSPQLLVFLLFRLCLVVRTVIGGPRWPHRVPLTSRKRRGRRWAHNNGIIFRYTFNCRCPGSGSEQEPSCSLSRSCSKRAALPFKSRPAPTATVERARYRYHPDSVPQIDKAAGDLQTPFNKAPFS